MWGKNENRENMFIAFIKWQRVMSGQVPKILQRNCIYIYKYTYVYAYISVCM